MSVERLETSRRVTVVVPVRNAADRIAECLIAIRANRPAEIIVVDGRSTDGTADLAHGMADRVLTDDATGPAAARQLGAEAATTDWLAFVDVDVDLPPDALASLLAEADERGLDALQAGLRSVGAGDFWSEELAAHHNAGVSKGWFGVSATVIRRAVILAHPFDARLRSGEDVDLRRTLRSAGLRTGVSRRTVVTHHFAPGFGFARDQWLADGAGLGRLVRKDGVSAVPTALVPFPAAAVGWFKGLRHPLRHGLYFLSFAVGNLIGLTRGLRDAAIPITRASRRLLVLALLALLWVLPVLVVLLAAGVIWLVLAAVFAGNNLAVEQVVLPLVTVVAIALAVITELGRTAAAGSPVRTGVARFGEWTTLVVSVAIVLSIVRLAGIVVG